MLFFCTFVLCFLQDLEKYLREGKKTDAERVMRGMTRWEWSRLEGGLYRKRLLREGMYVKSICTGYGPSITLFLGKDTEEERERREDEERERQGGEERKGQGHEKRERQGNEEREGQGYEERERQGEQGQGHEEREIQAEDRQEAEQWRTNEGGGQKKRTTKKQRRRERKRERERKGRYGSN